MIFSKTKKHKNLNSEREQILEVCQNKEISNPFKKKLPVS